MPNDIPNQMGQDGETRNWATIEFQCILCYDYRRAEWTKRRIYENREGDYEIPES